MLLSNPPKQTVSLQDLSSHQFVSPRKTQLGKQRKNGMMELWLFQIIHAPISCLMSCDCARAIKGIFKKKTQTLHCTTVKTSFLLLALKCQLHWRFVVLHHIFNFTISLRVKQTLIFFFTLYVAWNKCWVFLCLRSLIPWSWKAVWSHRNRLRETGVEILVDGFHTAFVARALIWLCDCNAADGFVFSGWGVWASCPPSYSVLLKFHYNFRFVFLNCCLAASRAVRHLAKEEKHLLE